MRLVIKAADLDRLQKKHGDEKCVAGYADENKLIMFPVPKMFVVICNHDHLKLIQLNMNLEEKNIEKIPYSSIEKITISGAVGKSITITTANVKYKLLVKSLAGSIRSYQHKFLDRMTEIQKEYV